MDLFSEAAFKTSKIVTKTYSTSFSIAVSMLGDDMQNAISILAAFMALFGLPMKLWTPSTITTKSICSINSKMT